MIIEGSQAARALPGAWMECLPRLERYARSLSRARPDEADDLVQATVERALRLDWETADIQCPEAYLVRVLRNIHRDQMRRRKANPTCEVTELPEVRAPATQDLNLICAETLRAIERLSPVHRTMLRMAAFEGLSYREMAARLDLPLGTVTSRLARARTALAAAIGWDREPVPYPV